MKNPLLKCIALPLLASPLLFLGGCGCGFDCSSDDDDDSPAYLTLSLSDALPEDLSEVAIEIDTITLKRSSGDVVFDTFNIDSEEVNTFQINLLEYPGTRKKIVIESREIETGTYASIELGIIDTDENNAYVLETETGTVYPLEVEDNFSLPGISVVSGEQEYVIEFGLAQSLSQPSSDTYKMSTTGVRVQNIATAARLSGQIDSTLFNSVSPCDEKTDPESGNRLYLYETPELDEETLSDVFTGDSEDTPPGDAIAPFAVATLGDTLGGNWEYAFGYLPAGDYTLAFSCDTAGDDAINFDGLTIPLPTDQISSFTLDEGESYTCNLTADGICQ